MLVGGCDEISNWKIFRRPYCLPLDLVNPGAVLLNSLCGFSFEMNVVPFWSCNYGSPHEEHVFVWTSRWNRIGQKRKSLLLSLCSHLDHYYFWILVTETRTDNQKLKLQASDLWSIHRLMPSRSHHQLRWNLVVGT